MRGNKSTKKIDWLYIFNSNTQYMKWLYCKSFYVYIVDILLINAFWKYCQIDIQNKRSLLNLWYVKSCSLLKSRVFLGYGIFMTGPNDIIVYISCLLLWIYVLFFTFDIHVFLHLLNYCASHLYILFWFKHTTCKCALSAKKGYSGHKIGYGN